MEHHLDDGEPSGTGAEDASVDIDRIRLALRDSYMQPFSYDHDLRRRLAEAVLLLSYDKPPALAEELKHRLQALAAAPEGYAENGYINDALAEAFLAVLETIDEFAFPRGRRLATATILH